MKMLIIFSLVFLIGCKTTDREINWESAVHVIEVLENSPAYNEGVRIGAVITGIGFTEITNSQQLITILEIQKNSDEEAAYAIWQNGKPKFYALPSSLEEAGLIVQNGKLD